MKRFTFLALLLCSYFAYSQDHTYTIDMSYESLSTTACNIFATATTVDNFVHKSTIGFPTFSGNSDYCINLPCNVSGSLGTEYQIVFPFKQGNTYTITPLYRGVTTNGLYPVLAFGLNETEKTHNTSTTCTGPKNVSQNYNFYATSGSTFAWTAPGQEFNTGALLKNYASLSVASYPDQSSGTLQVRTIVIREWCNQPALGLASGLTGTLTMTNPPAYGYLLNFNPVSGATEYLVEWYDVTNSALAGTFTISGPGYLNTAYITSGHTYRYRVQAKSHCSSSAFSDWSPELAPLGATCENGPIPSSLGFTLHCLGCNTFELNWPAVPGAIQYRIRYYIFQPTGIHKIPVTTNTASTSLNVTTNIIAGSGWYVNYQVAVDCGAGYGNYSDVSPMYLLEP